MTRWHPDQFERYIDRATARARVRRTDNVEVCDFCLIEGPTWDYPAGEMEIVGHPLINRSDDEWGACDECHDLIEAGNVNGLVYRMVYIHRWHDHGGDPRIQNQPLALARRNARTNVLAFLDARTGPAQRYEP